MEWKLSALLGNYDRQTDRRTNRPADRPGQRAVSLAIILQRASLHSRQFANCSFGKALDVTYDYNWNKAYIF